MVDWLARSITVRPEREFIAYTRVDHAGWHFASEPPEHVIPTGHVWTWGGSDWAAWWEETGRRVGPWLCRADVTPGDDWKPAIVDVLGPPGERTLPSLHRDKRFFRSSDGNADWHGLPAHTLRATVLARVDLLDCPEAMRR